jgi:hypothetical protein
MTLVQFAAQTAKGDAWIVDPAGNIHATSWAGYVELPSSALHGCLIFTSSSAAVKCAARIWARREAMS